MPPFTRLLPLLLSTVLSTGGSAIATSAETAPRSPDVDEQIAAAVQAAPEERRADAGVIGFSKDGANTLLRAGRNDLICLADDPGKDGFQTACYHRDLEPFMARGRELRKQGVTDAKERNATRWKEIEAGNLSMPSQPTTLYILEGSAYDAAADEVTAPYRRWVIYVPYATAESTGLATQPNGVEPWLMVPGTPSAHIMVTPPRSERTTP